MKNIDVEKVTFKSLSEAVYDGRKIPYMGVDTKKGTVEFTLITDSINLRGHVELTKDEYIKNINNIEELIAKKLNESF